MAFDWTAELEITGVGSSPSSSAVLYGGIEKQRIETLSIKMTKVESSPKCLLFCVLRGAQPNLLVGFAM